MSRTLRRAGRAITFLLGIIVLAIAPSHAQKRPSLPPVAVHSSPHGMYIVLGQMIVSPAHPVRDTAGYRIERRSKGEQWRALADVAAISTYEEYRALFGDKGVEGIAKLYKAPSPQAMWDTIVARPYLKKLPFLGSRQSLRAFGMLFLDSTAVQGRTYEYRVSRLLRSGAAVNASVSPPSLCGKPWVVAVLRPTVTGETDSSCTIEWVGPQARPFPSVLHVFRRLSGQEDFREVETRSGTSRRGDTMVASMSDKDLLRNQEYQYYIVPEDFFENRGPASSVATAYTINPTRLPLPLDVTASKDTLGVRLTWRTRGKDYVMATRIYRSLHIDKDFRMIAEVPSTDSSYLDVSATGMIRYYYRLSSLSYRNRESQKTALVFGFFKNPLPPMTPQNLTATPVRGGVDLKWDPNSEPDLAGYYVLRGASRRDSLVVVSPLVTTPRFLDTSALLSGAVEYRYAVVARNTSEVRSLPSHEALARPRIATNPTPPTGLTARRYNGLIVLNWADPREIDPSVIGYVVYRAKKGTALKPAIRIEYNPDRLTWIDSSGMEGETYVYAVSSLDMFGYEGKQCGTVQAGIPLVLPEPPGDLHAARAEKGVLVEWELKANAGGYVVYRSERGGKPKKIASVKPHLRTYADAAASKGVVYYYSIAAVDVKGREGRRSREVYVLP